MTFDHDYIRERLSGFVDGELTAEDQHLVAQHLAECDECAEVVEELRQMDDLVAEHSELADSDYWETQALAIEQKLGFAETEVTDVRPLKKKPSGWMWKTVSIAASIAVLTFIGYHAEDIMRDGEGTSPTPPPTIQKQTDDRTTDEETRSESDEEMAEDADQQPPAAPDAFDVGQLEQEVVPKIERAEQRQPVKPLTSPTPTSQEEVTPEVVAERPLVAPVQQAPSAARRVEPSATQSLQDASQPPTPVPNESVDVTRAHEMVSESLDLAASNYKLQTLLKDEALAQGEVSTEIDSLKLWRAAVAEYAGAKEKSSVGDSRKKTSAASQSDRSRYTQGFAGSGVTVPSKTDSPDQLSLAYACYKVALLSEDREERNNAMAILDSLLASEVKPVKDTALVLIKKLHERE